MAVKIKLKRMGKIRNPQYRIIVADGRTKRDGRAIEEIGKYHPKENPSFIEVDSERVQYWLGVGAQPTEPVMSLLKVTGDWQKFKGLPGADGRLKAKEAAADKTALFNAALAEAHGEPATEATTPKKRSAKKSAAKKAAAGEKAPEEAGGDTAAADEAPAKKAAKKTAKKAEPASDEGTGAEQPEAAGDESAAGESAESSPES